MRTHRGPSVLRLAALAGRPGTAAIATDSFKPERARIKPDAGVIRFTTRFIGPESPTIELIGISGKFGACRIWGTLVRVCLTGKVPRNDYNSGSAQPSADKTANSCEPEALADSLEWELMVEAAFSASASGSLFISAPQPRSGTCLPNAPKSRSRSCWSSPPLQRLPLLAARTSFAWPTVTGKK